MRIKTLKDNSITKEVLRKCVGCQKTFERTSLIRILYESKTEKIIIEPDKKNYGRSVYLCKNEHCLKDATKKNRISRALKHPLTENDIENLKNIIFENHTK